jgi:hypothetical protein
MNEDFLKWWCGHCARWNYRIGWWSLDRCVRCQTGLTYPVWRTATPWTEGPNVLYRWEIGDP